VRSAGGLQPLLDACASEYPEIQDAALSSISKCSQDGMFDFSILYSLVQTQECHLRDVYPDINFPVASLAELRKISAHMRLAELFCGFQFNSGFSQLSSSLQTPRVSSASQTPSASSNLVVPVAIHGIINALCTLLQDSEMNIAMKETPIANTLGKMVAKEDVKLKRATFRMVEALGHAGGYQHASFST
jgi:hypothetical protein